MLDAQEGAPDKGGETAAIPDLLRVLALRGRLVSLGHRAARGKLPA